MSDPIIDYSQTVVLPVVVVVPTPVSEDRMDVTGWADLLAIPTALLPTGTRFRVVTGAGSDRVEATLELLAGAADPADPMQRNPDDYDAAINDKHWQVVGGLLQ